LEIPYEKLTPETVRSLASEFVLREGTDYGTQEVTLDQKIDQVVKAIKSNYAKIVFDPKTEMCSIVVTD